MVIIIFCLGSIFVLFFQESVISSFLIPSLCPEGEHELEDGTSGNCLEKLFTNKNLRKKSFLPNRSFLETFPDCHVKGMALIRNIF